jgi:cell division protein FtsI (penicillin-binding protein 3)
MRRANKRLGLFMGLAVLFLIGLAGRAFYVQVVAASSLQGQAVVHSTRTVEINARRGTIYDRNGEALAVSQAMSTVYASPKEVTDPATEAARLAPLLGLSEADLFEKLNSGAGFRYLARRIQPAVGEQVEALNLAGIKVVAEDKRVYPKGALAPQLLGFVGGDADDADAYKGRAGVELQYDSVLSGTPGETTVVEAGRTDERVATVATKEAVPGRSVTLTIDSEIQYKMEQVLAGVVETFKAKKAFGVILVPETGEVLAMANTPVFDANQYASNALTELDRRNAVVTDQYEPGSTFKMLVAATALQAGLVQPDTVFKLAPEITVYDQVIHEAHDDVPEVRNLTVTEIIAQSSNVGAVTLGLEVGKDRLSAMISEFNFTRTLGIDFPGETAGVMPAENEWYGTMIANVSYGQGVAVSPLQLAAAYAAVANDGILVQPHLLKTQTDFWSRRVINAVVAAQLRDMLLVTVTDGTGSRGRVSGYEVAGKTGTAQKVKLDGTGYDENRYVASFVGMVPASDPQLVILVMVDEPTTQHLGGLVAAPAFSEIADFALKRLGIPPNSSN